MIRWKHLLSGAGVFVAIHLVLVSTWQTSFSGGNGFRPWFMNSGRAAMLTMGCLLVVNMIVGVARLVRFEEAILAACNIAAGAVVAMTLVLFGIGPGNLFPIAIVMGAVIIGASSVSGAIAGWGLRSLFSRSPRA